MVEEKKKIKYPQLSKPTYYPEIDTLDISDDEKLRLDKAARWNLRNYMSKSNIGRLTHKLSIEDLELLTSIGVVKKKYNFRCKNCNESCNTISESDLEKYKRVFELEEITISLSEEQDKELASLYEEGFYAISACCMECDEDDEISNMHELKAYEDYIETFYIVAKKPDLTYEKM